MAKKRFYEESGKTSGMISSNSSAQANLPQEVSMKNYPTAPYGMDAGIDDTISGIDAQMSVNNPAKKGSFKPKKY